MSDGDEMIGQEREVKSRITPGALTLDERFDRVNILIGRSGLVASDMDELRGHVGALCRTITQQAQELALTRGAMASQDERERKAGEQCGVPYAESGCDWPWSVAEVVQSLRQQLATSRALCAKFEAIVHDHQNGACNRTIAQLQATLASREAEIDRLKLAQQHSIQDECEAEQRLIDAGISDYEDDGDYRGLLTQIGLCIKERDAASRDARRYRYLRARAALDGSYKHRITWYLPRYYQDTPVKDQLDMDLDEAIKRHSSP